jgi:hypothetical protein
VAFSAGGDSGRRHVAAWDFEWQPSWSIQMKKLLLTVSYLAAAICIAFMTSRSASAQCNYRMNDIGRPHGYLSGPCNGAAQGYSGAYPSRQATWYRRNGSISPSNPNLRTVRNGNTVHVYDGKGRVLGHGIRRGNIFNYYNAQGRLVRKGVFGRNGASIYDMRGRLVSSTPDVRDAR